MDINSSRLPLVHRNVTKKLHFLTFDQIAWRQVFYEILSPLQVDPLRVRSPSWARSDGLQLAGSMIMRLISSLGRLCCWNEVVIERVVTEFWLIDAPAKRVVRLNKLGQLMQESEMVVNKSTVTSLITRTRKELRVLYQKTGCIETVGSMAGCWNRYP